MPNPDYPRDDQLQNIGGKAVARDGVTGDHGGHMVGARFNGPVDLINYHAQHGPTNTSGAWKQMEDEWDAVLRGAELRRGGQVIIPANPNVATRTVTDVVITATFPNSTTRRPSSFSVMYKVGGVTPPNLPRVIQNP